MENKNKRYLSHELHTKYHAVISFINEGDVQYTCRKYHISRASLYRWIKKFDGTKESLIDRSSKPKTRHPKSHSNQEIKWIRDYARRNPKITLNELWYKLKREKGYNRNITSLYRVMRRLNIKFECGKNIKNTSKKKHNKRYDTPLFLGEKWQIDVKYVPNECKSDCLPFDIKYYQYTCIDEATRERYLYWYEEHTPANTVDFIKRCLKFYGYKPKEIQTDNGIEFTYNQAKIKKQHPVDNFLQSINVKHHKIQPRTPEHNGKVERSHRNDNERFYSFLKFFSLEDLRKQGANYLRRSNNIPMAVLHYLTPKEKRQSLLLPVLVA